MERREFLRGLIAASLAITLAPDNLLKAGLGHPERLVHMFKVSHRLWKQPDADGNCGITSVMPLILEELSRHPDRKIHGSVISGYVNDDFAKDLITVRFETIKK